MQPLLPIFSFALSTAITPGPNNIMLAASGSNFGYRPTVPHILGICGGFPFMILAVGIGMGSLFHKYPVIHQILKYVGSLFLLYLAWRIATFHPLKKGDVPTGKPLTFWQAALFQWLNPKAWVLVVVAIPMFTSGENGILSEILVIALVYLAVSFPCASAWALFGTGIRRWLSSPLHHTLFNVSMALLLVASVALTWFLH